MRCQTGLMFRPARAALLLKPLAVALFLLLPFAAEAQEKTCLEQVRGMKLESLPGQVPTYYSSGHRQRASEMKALLEEAARYYERELGVKIEVTLAAVAQAEWASLLDKPYGLPTMRTGPCRGGGPGSSAQYVAIMPVTVGGPIYDGWVEMKGALSAGSMKRLKAAVVEFEQGGRLLLDFVALHELGHAYAHGYGLNPLSGFFAEHVTNYLTYAFMRSTKGQARPEGDGGAGGQRRGHHTRPRVRRQVRDLSQPGAPAHRGVVQLGLHAQGRRSLRGEGAGFPREGARRLPRGEIRVDHQRGDPGPPREDRAGVRRVGAAAAGVGGEEGDSA